MISSNHYQAPVRRFILDLFDVPLDMEVLDRLVKLEQTSLRLINRGQNLTHGRNRSNELRRRSASSPGPEPVHKEGGERPGTRIRGLTISRMEGQERVDGFQTVD